MQLVIGAVVVAVVVAVALIIQRKRRADPPTQTTWGAPAQLDRADFGDARADWLVVTFTSATCHTCADVKRKAAVLASNEVSVVDVEYGAQPALHARYQIDAVPTLVIADRDGVVLRAFHGPVTATDLWSAVAVARGDAPPPACEQHG